MAEEEIKWTAPEFEYHHKEVSWYWISAMAAIVMIAIALWRGNFLFVVFIVLAEIVIVSWAAKIPRYVDFTLSQDGLEIHGHTFYPYKSFDGFAAKEIDGELSELILKRKVHLSPYLKVLVETKDISAIKRFLNNFLPEIEYEESMFDHIAKLLRF